MAPRAGLTTTRVVATAGDLADRDGLDTLTLTAVATELGVRTPSLYAHVDGMVGLMSALRVRGIEQLGERLRDAAVGRAGDDAVSAIVHAIRTFATEHPALYAASVAAPTETEKAARLASDRAVGVVVTVLAHYGLSGDDAIHAARFLRSAVHGFVDLERQSGFGLPTDIDQSFALLVDQVQASMANWAARAPA